jgi:hypothetical protein
LQYLKDKLELSKPCAKSLSHSQPESSLPSIFSKPFRKGIKINWPAFMQKPSNPKEREISTPYFQSHRTETRSKQLMQKKRQIRKNFFDHVKQRKEEFSFGSIEEALSN